MFRNSIHFGAVSPSDIDPKMRVPGFHFWNPGSSFRNPEQNKKTPCPSLWRDRMIRKRQPGRRALEDRMSTAWQRHPVRILVRDPAGSVLR